MAFFLISAGLSTAFSAHPFHALIRSTWTPLILAAVLVLALLPPLPRRSVTVLVTLSICILCLGSLWQLYTATHLEAGRIWRARGFLPHPNDAAVIPLLMVLVPVSIWPVGLLTVLWSGSRNALLGLLVIGCCRWRRWWQRAALIGMALAGGLFLAHAAQWTSLAARLGHWRVAWQMFVEAPWLGKGPHTFVDYYLPYSAALGPGWFGVEPEVAFIPWAHSLYLEQMGERGLLGLLAFLIPLAFVWCWGGAAIRSALLAFLVMGIADLSLLKPWVVAAYWGLVWLAAGGRHGLSVAARGVETAPEPVSR